MVLTKIVFSSVAGLVALTTNAAPLDKRIAQVISDSTQQWVQACTAAGGAEQCGTTSQNAFMALLAGGGDCDQQNAADDMMDLAKSLGNDAKMISLTQVFAQQPRNSPNKLSVNYCQQEPKNAELKGLFQCQFEGVDPKTFTNNVKVGGKGTIPLGLNAPLDPPGSCKANSQGGIADGSQLVALTQDPGVKNDIGAGSTGTSNVGASPNATSTPDDTGTNNTGSSDGTGSDTDSASDSGNTTDTGSAGASGEDAGSNSTADPTGSDTSDTSGGGAQSNGGSACTGGSGSSGSGASASSTTADSAASSGSSNFQLQNGKDAQALNAKFASLTDSSPCQEGDQACVNNGFAQCVSGKFQTTQCAAGTQCFALPLVNSAGTSIACTTQSDATSRIQATGSSGGLTGA